jgi:hypothetical protein
MGMGIGPSWGRSAGVSAAATSTSKTAPNPNPHRFQIRWIKEYSNCTAALVHYPDCDNFEGEKLLVFSGMCAAKIRAMRVLDPHFREDMNLIARLRPDELGMRVLKKIAIEKK